MAVVSANTGANTVVGPIQVSNTEVLITAPLKILPNALANGQMISVKVFGSVGGPGYNLNIRVGANANVTDNVVYNQNTVYTTAFLENDAANWANSNPGFGPNLYPGPNPVGFGPALKLNAEFFLVAQNVGATHAFLQIVDPNGALGNTGIGANTLGFDSTVAQNLSVSHSVQTPPQLVFAGFGHGQANSPMANSFNVVAASKGTSNSVITLARVEVVALPN